MLPLCSGVNVHAWPGPPPADLQLATTQAYLALGQREQAAALTLNFWRAHQPEDELPQRAHMHMAFLLDALSESLASPPADAIPLLRRLIPILSTPACSAVESLAARWLPLQVPAGLRGTAEHALLAEPFVQSALAGSRTFGTKELEPLVCAARKQLLSLLMKQAENGAGGGTVAFDGHEGAAASSSAYHHQQHRHAVAPSSGGITVQVAEDAALVASGGVWHTRLESAAAIALWAHFTDFCLEETPEEANAVAVACGAIEGGLPTLTSFAGANSSSSLNLAQHCQLALLAAVGMYQDLAELRSVEHWLREPEPICAALKAAGLARVWAMLEAQVVLPRASPRRRLAVITPIHCQAVRSFYDMTVYPKWHVAEVFGTARAPSIAERMRRQYRHFRWPHGEDSSEHRMLIAGAGSGHQVAQALLSYEHVEITAVDLSPRTLAFSHQRLHAVLPQETARRVHFAVADLLALPSAGLPPFELAAAIGVLHHVPRPDVPHALASLAASLKPGGVLQLATYSTIGIASWWEPTRRLVHKLAPSIVDEHGQLLRQPAPYELRELRAAVLRLEQHLPSADEADRAAHSHVTCSAEFYTSTGCRDLMLHPCECSFTLLELGALIDGAGLDLVGVWFGSLEADRRAREAYRRSGAASGYAPGDGPDVQVDLRRWHELEANQPELFGRMHVLYLQKRWQH